MSPSIASPESAVQLNPGNWNEPSHAQNATARTQFIIFATDDDYRSANIMTVREIKGRSEANHLRKQTDSVRDSQNLRGVIVPTVDRRCHFGHGVTRPLTL
jgi:chemotaxis signal transduction protein